MVRTPSNSIWKIIMADEVYPRRHPDFAPTHPGEILRDEVLPALNLPVKTVAEHLGVTRQALHRVLAGTASITPEMALRIGRFCGNGPDIWLRMQGTFDLWYAERALRDELAKIPTPRAA